MGALRCARFLFVLGRLLPILKFFLLTNEPFYFLAVPPRSSLDNLPNCGVIVTFANVESVIIAASFWPDAFVLCVNYLVDFLHQFYVCSVQKVGFFYFLWVDAHWAVASRHRNIEEFQQLSENLLFWLHFLLKQDHYDLVCFLNSLIDHMFAKMCIWHERRRLQLTWCILLTGS